MKRFLLSGVAAVSLISSACSCLAADMSTPPPVYSWTGFYVGANLGGVWTAGTLNNNVTRGSVSTSDGGFIGGGQLGFNWQYGNFVLGAEWLFDGTDLNTSGVLGNLSTPVWLVVWQLAMVRQGRRSLGPELRECVVYQSRNGHRHPGDRIVYEQRMDGRNRS
jgi:opacity protein-like surface antigen